MLIPNFQPKLKTNHQRFVDSFNRFRKDNHLCDVKIKAGNRIFSAHKVSSNLYIYLFNKFYWFEKS
jgi:hypothetical protein